MIAINAAMSLMPLMIIYTYGMLHAILNILDILAYIYAACHIRYMLHAILDIY